MSQSIFDQALHAHRKGDGKLAEQLYKAVLTETPGHLDGMALLGTLYSENGLHAEAIDLLEQVIKRDSQASLFRFYLANACFKAGYNERAILHYREALALQPELPIVYYNLGNALRLVRQEEAALEAYRTALHYAPQYVEARHNLALLLRHQTQDDLALYELQRAVKDQPYYAEGWLTLCRMAGETGHLDLSLMAGQRAVELLPEDASAYLALGTAFSRLEKHPEAEKAYKRAITHRPDWPDLWDNLGLTYQWMNKFEEAEAAFRKTIDLAGQTIADDLVRVIDERDFGIRHWHLAQLELLKGNYEIGFGRYRCRFSAQGGLKRMDYVQPYWRGEDIKGKIILVMDEEGRGDGLMLCRYLPLLRARGAYVKFYVRPVFGRLFKGWEGADEVITHDEPIGDFDLYTWVLDLPYCFNTTLDSLPATVPYLPLLKDNNSDYKFEREDEKKIKVGVIWAGSTGQALTRSTKVLHDRRHVPLNIFSKLFELEGCEFYSLTRDKKDGDDDLIEKYHIVDLAKRIHDFRDLAQFVQQLDIIISCDTALPHLAGGMGKEIWTLLACSADWRWLTECEDSPWYPTMRLFRQSTNGDWDELIRRVKKTLKQRVESLGILSN